MEPSESLIRYEVSDGVATIRLDRRADVTQYACWRYTHENVD